MISVKCENCKTQMNYDENNGMFTCPECLSQILVTDLSHPQLGNIINSVFDSDKACNNIAETNGTYHSENSNIPSNWYIVPCTLSKDIAISNYKRWALGGLFSPSKYNASHKKDKLILNFIPCIVYSLFGQGEIEATCTKRFEKVNSKKRDVITDYYLVGHKIEDSYEELLSYELCGYPISEIMEKIGAYTFDNAIPLNDTNIDNATDYNAFIANYRTDNRSQNHVADATVIMPSNLHDITNDRDTLDKITQKVRTAVENNTLKSLNNLTANYDSTYTENTQLNTAITDIRYILVPVWSFENDNTPSNNAFFMNGQTGAIYGKCPVSIVKLSAATLLIGFILFGVLMAILILIGIIV